MSRAYRRRRLQSVERYQWRYRHTSRVRLLRCYFRWYRAATPNVVRIP